MGDWLPANFHFLRPWALWGLVPLLPLIVFAHWREGAGRLAAWRGRIDAHLLAALTVGAGRRWGLRPIHTLALALALGCLGLAGPAWQREPMPLVEDRAPLVVILDLGASMDAVDVSPTRLERAKLKLRVLLEHRQAARTALVVFGGRSAHRILPLGDDPNLLLTYVPALGTDLMPANPPGAGKALAAALSLAAGMLEKEPTPGSFLLLTDGFDVSQAEAMLAFRERSRSEILLLAFGGDAPAALRRADGGYVTDAAGHRLTARLGRAGLEAAAAGGLWLASATADDRDIEAVEARIQRHMAEALADDPAARWRDRGIWLALPAAALLLLAFRPGWAVRWSQGLLLAMCLGTSWPAGPARAAEPGRQDWRFADLWASRDQQGRWQFEHGRHDAAAASFADPLWRGIALYRAGRYAEAADAFAAVDTAEGQYNLGNTLAHLGSYPEALAAYDQALGRRPAWPEALANRALVAALLPAKTADDQERGEGHPDELDQSPFGQKRKGRKLVRQLTLSEAEIARLWLARIQISPAGFLKQRFTMEAQAAEGAVAGNGVGPRMQP
ncbi:MAG: VWA domain-containing protein [Rhodocyclaceae bacterium]|jgi:Ca-activated chloride channel family protein|nr:VWA domain-containing protein [Rhodocyclaceae bacterium]MBK9312335.1 VWA domain-containing protein [Rhodocyclaceae bacterium]